MSVEMIQFDVSNSPSTHEVKQVPPAEGTAETPAPATLVPAAPVPMTPNERLWQAETIIYRNTFWSMGAGALAVPGLDLLAASAVHLKQLKQLSDLYGVKFSEGIAKKLVSTLLMSLGGVGLGLLAGSAIKLIPGVGSALGVLSMPMSVAASNRALGHVFVMHFEAGGTLLDFEPKKMQEYFKLEFEKAKDQAAQLKDQAKDQAAQLKDQAVQLKDQAKEQAAQLKDQAKEQAAQLKDKVTQKGSGPGKKSV